MGGSESPHISWKFFMGVECGSASEPLFFSKFLNSNVMYQIFYFMLRNVVQIYGLQRPATDIAGLDWIDVEVHARSQAVQDKVMPAT